MYRINPQIHADIATTKQNTTKPCTYPVGYAVLTAPDSNVHGGNMGPIWGRQDPGGPHIGPMKLLSGAFIHVYSQVP